MTVYLLDTNVFIEAKNRFYGMDFCPAFWDWLIIQNQAGTVVSIEKVGDELQAGNDELSAWALARGASFFMPPNTAILPALQEVSLWSRSQRYEPSAVATFLQIADYWLVAHAKAHGHTVVTQEVPDNSTRNIKIPSACIGLKLPFVNVFEMLRREHARFVLGNP